MAGDNTGSYAQEVLEYIAHSPYQADIEILGRVPAATKVELMQKSHFIAVTSLKEGWGLIVSEAASQGTPAVVYDVDGLRDSVRDGKTGYVTEPNPASLAEGIIHLLKDPEEYNAIRYNAWEWSHELTQDNCYKDFKNVLEIA
jgi:glycosyltransferase involved in cell wall biosynthesis